MSDDVPEPQLSPRQIACLQLAAQGKRSPEIAEALGISRRTVDQYFEEAGARLDARTRVQAVAKAVRLGLVSDEPSAV